MTTPVLRYLLVPGDIDLSGSELRSASGFVSFSGWFQGLVPFLPCSTLAEAETLEQLVERIGRAEAATVVELREADHAALVRALGAWRQTVPPSAHVTLLRFLVAVARASVTPPAPPPPPKEAP